MQPQRCRRRGPLLAVALAAVLAACLAPHSLPTRVARGDPSQAGSVRVELRAGHVLQGRSVTRTQVDGLSFLRIETDFGQLLVPTGQVEGTTSEHARGEGFAPTEIRIVRLEGSTLRRAAGATAWEPLSGAPAYAGAIAPRLAPGDGVRTGADGTVELLLHRNAWVRIAPNSEVELGAPRSAHALSLLKGSTVQEVSGALPGGTFRLRSPSAVLGVRGTRWRTVAQGSNETLCVGRGAVEVEGRGEVRAGEIAALTGGAPLAPARATRQDLEGLEVERGARPPDDLVFVPGGEYVVGLAAGMRAEVPRLVVADTEGRPVLTSYARARVVRLGPFLIDRYEVSGADYARFAQATARTHVGPSGSGPVHGVTHADAATYAAWVGKQLPTSSQWEVAGRGTEGRYYPWGNRVTSAHRALVLGAYDGRVWKPPPSLPPATSTTLDVSEFGVCALATGVPEWVRDPLREDATYALLEPDLAQLFGPATGAPPAFRGHGASLLSIEPRGDTPVGLRGVIELR